MDRARHKRNYDLHSWSGVTLGLFIYVVAFTGCFALFYHEVQTWEDPARRLPMVEEPVDMQATLNDWIAEKTAGDLHIDFLTFTYPSEVEPYYSAFLGVDIPREGGGHDHEFSTQRWDPATGEALPERGEGLSLWLLEIHRKLMWPDFLGGVTVGRGIVGIAGVILLMSIITGVIAHTKILEELFTLRFFRSMRLKWQDAHKVFGLWGLPFYVMIAITGAVLGVVTLLAPVIALLTFKGDQEALIAAVLGEPQAPAGVEAQMISVDELRTLTEPTSGERLRYVVMNNFGDANAYFDLYFDPDTELMSVEGYQISGVTGERMEEGASEDSAIDTSTPANRVLATMTPLHYGTYGGISLKFLYFVLGLALAVITGLGMMMWVERRKHGNVGSRSPQFYHALSKLTVGVTCGLPLATAAVFYADRLAPVAPEGRLAVVGWTYFLVWSGAIGFSLFRNDDYRTVRELLAASGALLAGVPLLDMATTGDFFLLSIFVGAGPEVWVNLSCLVIGVLTVLSAVSLPRTRTDNSRRKEETAMMTSLRREFSDIAADEIVSVQNR